MMILLRFKAIMPLLHSYMSQTLFCASPLIPWQVMAQPKMIYDLLYIGGAIVWGENSPNFLMLPKGQINYIPKLYLHLFRHSEIVDHNRLLLFVI